MVIFFLTKKIFNMADDVHKRSLLNTMFSNLYLLDGRMKYEVNPAFKVVKDKVIRTNEMLLQSLGVVEIRDVGFEKPELEKDVVINEMGYQKLSVP